MTSESRTKPPSRHIGPVRTGAVTVLMLIAACSNGSSSAIAPNSPAETIPADSQSVPLGEPSPTTDQPAAGATPASTAPGDSSDAPSSTAQFISAAEASRAAAAANEGKQFGGEEFGLSERELVERSETVQANIGACMAAAGFEYFPVDFSAIERAMSSDKSAPGLSRSEFVAQYGFGMSTQFDKPIVELSLGDANRRVLESLGDADRVAYRRTLLGEHEDATYAFGLETENFSRTGGCTQAAIEQSFTEAEMSASYFNPGDALIATDPRAVQAIADWYDCMVAGGIEAYLHPDDVEADFLRRFDTLTAGTDPADLTGAELDALTRLQDEERAVAGVFTDCEVNVLDPIMNRVEAEFYGR